MSASHSVALPAREQLVALRSAAARASSSAAASADKAWTAALGVVDELTADLARERAEHEALKRKYEEDNLSWRKFKAWWASKLEDRRSRIAASSAGAQPASGSGKPRSPRRDALNAEEQALLLKVGLDPGQLVLDTASDARTVAKRPGGDDKSSSSPAAKRARASDGSSKSSAKSRSRASSGQASPSLRSGSGRRSLGNVTNTSLGDHSDAATRGRAEPMEVQEDEDGDISGIKVGGKSASEKMPPPARNMPENARTDASATAQVAPAAPVTGEDSVRAVSSDAAPLFAPVEQLFKDVQSAAARPATPAKQHSTGSDSSQDPPLFFHSAKRPPRQPASKSAAQKDGMATPAPARPAAKPLTAQAFRTTPAVKAADGAIGRPAPANAAAVPPVTPSDGTAKSVAATSTAARFDAARKAAEGLLGGETSRRTRILPPLTVQPGTAARTATPLAPRGDASPAPVWIRDAARNARPEASKARAPLASSVSDFGFSDDEQPNDRSKGARDGPSKSDSAAMELFDAEDAEERKRIRREKRRAKAAELAKDPNKFRGNGRYAREIEGDTSKTINAEFEVDPERNGGAAFPHKDVVRNKAERQRMYAFDCACCAEWYEAVGPGVTDAERDAAHQAHLQQTSRHRAYGPPSSTPPAYWRVDFPATPDAEDINRKAQEEHERKRRQMETDPRFKRRLQ